jgi:hypothetical protein
MPVRQIFFKNTRRRWCLSSKLSNPIMLAAMAIAESIILGNSTVKSYSTKVAEKYHVALS